MIRLVVERGNGVGKSIAHVSLGVVCLRAPFLDFKPQKSLFLPLKIYAFSFTFRVI